MLLEQHDFAKGTSSRSTKLIHGGVRYLQQGNISLVMEALKERGLLLQNAPHLVRDLEFIVPNYLWWEAPFYGIGMRVYDALAGTYGFKKENRAVSQEIGRQLFEQIDVFARRAGILETRHAVPGRPEGPQLRGYCALRVSRFEFPVTS